MSRELYGLDEDGGIRVSPSILDTPGYQRQIEGVRRLAKMHNEQKETTEETAARMKASMTAKPDLLPLPLPKGDVAEGGLDWTDEEMQAYARANLASAQAREESIVKQLRIETDRANAQYDRAERLAEALREAREYVASELAGERAKFAGYEHCSTIASIEADLAKIDAALEQESNDA